MIVDGFIINEAKRGVFRAMEVDRKMVQWVTDHMDQDQDCFDTNKAKCEGPWRAQCTRSTKAGLFFQHCCGGPVAGKLNFFKAGFFWLANVQKKPVLRENCFLLLNEFLKILS